MSWLRGRIESKGFSIYSFYYEKIAPRVKMSINMFFYIVRQGTKDLSLLALIRQGLGESMVEFYSDAEAQNQHQKSKRSGRTPTKKPVK